MSNIAANVSAEQLRKALKVSEQIEALQAELASILGGESSVSSGKRTMSPAARARIAAAQRERWAKVKGKTTGRRKMSAAAKARLSAIAAARWKKAKASGKNTL